MMPDKFFKFDEQLSIGDAGESEFKRYYSELNPQKSKDRKIDFILNNGHTVELKTDSYSMEKTPNFFMEQYTVSGGKTSLGGPWRTKEHGVNLFVYYFLNNKVFFWFCPTTLCEFLDKYIEDNKLSKISIPNKGNNGEYYEAQGYKIPRDVVRPIMLKQHTILIDNG